MLSTIADVLGILSFLISIGTFIATHTILKNVEQQRTEYESERYQLQTSLIALRDNIWRDHQPLNIRYRSEIRTLLYTYHQKYVPISSLYCIYHLKRAIHICNKPEINTKERENLCTSIDFLIARFNKTEVVSHE